MLLPMGFGAILVNLPVSGVLNQMVGGVEAHGIIGAADGPTAILVSQVLDSQYMGPIAVAAYSYMALVPIVQPMAIKLVTTKKKDVSIWNISRNLFLRPCVLFSQLQ